MGKLQVLLFSSLKQKIGQRMLTVELKLPLTGAQLLDQLAVDHPVIQTYRPVLRLAVNQEYVPESVEIADGDEVALITPVSGG